MTDILLVKDPYIVLPSKRERCFIPYRAGMRVSDVIADAKQELASLGFTEFAVSLNGWLVKDCSAIVKPNDVIGISVAHGDPGTFILSFTIFWGNTFLASVINTVIFIGAGLLLNSILAAPTPNAPSSDVSKPTYGWGGVRNETTPGDPVPVVHGRPYSAPKLIGSYRTVDTDHSMWQYLLMVAAAGKTNNVLTENDILIGDEAVTAYSDYVFGATDGDTAITETTRNALAPFAKVHHDRPFDRQLKKNDRTTATGVTILHFNAPPWSSFLEAEPGDFITPTVLNGYCYECTAAGTTAETEPAAWPTVPGTTISDGGVLWTCREYSSAPVADSSGRAAPWTRHGSAELKFDTPKFGTAYLHLPANGDYIATDDCEAMRLDEPAEIEFFYRFADLSNQVLFGQQISSPYSREGVVWPYKYQIITALCFIGGQLKMRHHYGIGNAIAEVEEWTAGVDLSGAFTPAVGTWYAFRVRTYNENYRRKIQVLAGQAGNLALVAEGFSNIVNYDPDRSDTVQAYSAQTAERRARYAQQIGAGYFVDVAAGTETFLYSRGDFDEWRMTRGLANDLDNLAIPTAEFGDPVPVEDPYVIQTKSKVDQVRIIIEFPHGLFRTAESGIGSKAVGFNLGYRQTGASEWTSATITASAAMTTPARFQYSLEFESRAKYDVRLERITPDSATDNNNERSASFLISFEEIIDIRQCYPGLQAIALGIKASETRSGQLGAIRVHHNRTQLSVPNWNGVGTRIVDARTPAYQLLDAFTNPHYGSRVPISDFPSADWEEWATWTNALVGGKQRAKSDIVFDEAGSLSDTAISHLGEVGRARIVRAGSDWLPVIDKPKAPQYLFSSGNIIKKSFTWESYEKPEVSDAVEVVFWNADKKGNRDSRIAKASWFETLTRNPKITSIEVRGIISAEQALRHAIFRIQKNEFITRHGKHRCALSGALVELGDVFHLVPPSSKWVAGGRLRRDHAAESVIRMTGGVYLDEATYSGKLKMIALDPNGAEQVFDVLGPWDTFTYAIEIDGAYTGNRWDTFGLGRIVEDRLLNQVVKKTINPKDKTVDLEWCEYSDSVFYHADYGGGLVAI